MKYLLRILFSAALAFMPLQAWAASGATTVPALDSNSTARNFNVYSSTGAITGNLSWMNAICDFTTVTQCAHVDSSGGLSVVGEGTAGTPAGGVFSIQGVSSGTAVPVSGTFWQATQPVSGTFWQSTQPVSAASLPLPSGAATSANQTAASPADESAFTQGTTPITQIGCLYIASYTAITTGHVGVLSCTSTGAANVNVVNSNANGATTASSSSPVVTPTDYVSGKAISSLVKGTTSAMTGTTSTQVLAAVTSKVIYVMNVDCVNSSSTATLVTLQDGSGGTALATVAAAASGGGHAVHATFPETWTTSGNGLYAADVTTGANVICTASGFAQ